MTRDYEQSQQVDAPPEEVFSWLADVGNLPEYHVVVAPLPYSLPAATCVICRG